MKNLFSDTTNLFSSWKSSFLNTAPSQNILGSYFPSWMLCALFGIILAVVVYNIFVKIRINEFIPFRLITYICIATSFTFIIWLMWFGN